MKNNSAFTLIELSIVLVIIGLIVGGILVGQDLINAAAIRAQISQIEKYNTAVNTFRVKYNYLPGDISSDAVTQFGFTTVPTRAGTKAQGDANGLLEGYDYRDSSTNTPMVQGGENLFFWEDLSANAGLIDGNFNTATASANPNCHTFAACSSYLPSSKLGKGMIYVFSSSGKNYFGISTLTSIDNAGAETTTPTLTVAQANNIDKKIDDGIPITGKVVAQYVIYPTWLTPAPNSSSASSSTCYDTTSGQYSMTQTNGTNLNCYLTFQFQ